MGHFVTHSRRMEEDPIDLYIQMYFEGAHLKDGGEHGVTKRKICGAKRA